MAKIKPRIVRAASGWACYCPRALGLGDTRELAYSDWACNLVTQARR